MKDVRDKRFLIGSFLLIKVMAGKLFFKPYKLTSFFQKAKSSLQQPLTFKENCVVFGYTLVALFTDFLFGLYREELERLYGQMLTTKDKIAEVKQKMFADLMPISDDYVLYKDFASVVGRNEWSTLVQSIHSLVVNALEAVKQHRHLTDLGLQRRVKEDLKELIQVRT